MANIVQISLTPHQEKHTFIYDWQETRRGGALDIHPERLTDDDEVARVIRGACPHAPDNISDDNNRNLIHGVEFGVTLGDHIVFTCKNEPFTVFFRYGRPDGGDFNSSDEEKQIRSDEREVREGAVTAKVQLASVTALIQGLYAPTIVAFEAGKKAGASNDEFIPGRFIYDRGLGFEVHPAGS